ncbi:MAG: restriction endonuclease subunit S [Anaerolineales bacterium]|nr:restriction endonuclease subunit S [Anaerolineales bacterium]
MGNSDWDLYTLGDLTENFDSIRVPVKEADRKKGQYPYYGASGIIDMVDGYLFDGEYLLVAEDGENLRSRKTSVAFMATGKFWVNNHAHIVRGNEIANTRYLMYYLSQTDISGFLTGSTLPKLTQDNLNRIPIYAPPLPEQRAIAGMLGALDDKIELNRRMNRTLESMARAVFRQWFVENEEVSKWDIAQIGDIADVIDCLHSKKPERQETGKPLLQLSNILENGLLDTTNSYPITEKDYNFWISRIEASPGDCVITNVGRVGAVAQIPEGFKAALGRNMTAVRCKKEYPYPTFLIECLMSDAMRQEINNKTDTGTILDALNVKNIPLLQFAMPHHKLLQEFEKTVRPIRAKMEHNLKESRTLASLRDSLLPKLMRGEVRVK